MHLVQFNDNVRGDILVNNIPTPKSYADRSPDIFRKFSLEPLGKWKQTKHAHKKRNFFSRTLRFSRTTKSIKLHITNNDGKLI